MRKKSKKRLLLENFFIVAIIAHIFLFIIYNLPLKEWNIPTDNSKYYYIESIIIFILFSFRDIIFNKHKIGKLIILNKNNKFPKKHILILRNISLIIWPIEAVMILLFNKRLGDIIFKTKVVEKV